jgi:hypothetical protein
MDPRWTRIIPDLNDVADDVEKYREEHHTIFGHYPPSDPGEKCEHPMHATIRRAMNDAQIEIPFDPDEIITEDSELERVRRERYGIVFAMTRSWQREVEARQKRDAEERAARAGIIIPS